MLGSGQTQTRSRDSKLDVLTTTLNCRGHIYILVTSQSLSPIVGGHEGPETQELHVDVEDHPHQRRIGIHPELSKRVAIQMHGFLSTRFGTNAHSSPMWMV